MGRPGHCCLTGSLEMCALVENDGYIGWICFARPGKEQHR
jgi:hypothetical protein